MSDYLPFNNLINHFRALYEKHLKNESGFNPTLCYQDTIIWLDKLVADNDDLHMTDPHNSEIFNNVCGEVARTFFRRFPLLSIQLLERYWIKLGLLQRETQTQQIYKAGIGYYLADLYLKRQDSGATTRWALLTHAEDALNYHVTGSGAHLVRSTLGIDDSIVDKINEIAKSKRELAYDWSHYSRFAEDVILETLLGNSQYAFLFSHTTDVSEFGINPAYFQALYEQASNSETSHEKGKSLEHLAAYLFSLVPGWIPQRNLIKENKIFETDILVSDLSHFSNVNAELFGRNFIVECKNYTRERVGSSHVGYFLYRAHLTHVNFAVLFTMNGITGEGDDSEAYNIDKKAATGLLRMAFHEDNIMCIVIDNRDLMKLKDEEISFRSLILQKANNTRFGN